ncbi:hypothetical protein PV327_011522, partial [Microctonus hyperodae]
RVRLSGRFIKKSKLQKITKGRETLLNFHENKEKTWNSEKCCVKGSRIINVAYLLQQLICIQCTNRLHLDFIKSETKFGLASTFKIECEKCLQIPSRNFLAGLGLQIR